MVSNIYQFKGFTDQDAYIIHRCCSNILSNNDEKTKFDDHEISLLIKINESMRNLSNGKPIEVNESMWWIVTKSEKI